MVRTARNPLSASMTRQVEFDMRCATALERVVAKDPADVEALERLGATWRRVGGFRAAHDVYRRLLARQPDSRSAAWLCAVTGGDRLPAPPPDRFRPSPFVRFMDFLEPAQHDRMLALALAKRESFRPAKVGNESQRRVSTRKRVGLETRSPDNKEISASFMPLIRSRLPEVFELLDLEGFEPPDVPAAMTVYLDGGFGAAHVDSTAEGPGLACVYYFHRSPKAFSGGDLLIHDTDVVQGSRVHDPLRFSRIAPADNSVVFFPSFYRHAVTPVRCPTDRFEDGRFAVSLWLPTKGTAKQHALQ